jgi:5-methyltetrahydrofolate--homocysteine methyltransferase
MPRLVDGATVFPATPEEMAQYISRFLEMGAGIVGGCCGTTPAHISAMNQVLDASSFTGRVLTDPAATRLSSRSSALFVGGNSPVRAVGERLNPTGRKALREALHEGNLDIYREEAARQQEAGAEMLDVNVGVPGIDEPETMFQAVTAVSQAVHLPLAIDSPRADVVEAGLKAADGKVLINSVTGEDESLEAVLPLARKYGAAVLGLALDERGIPQTAEERLEIARKIRDRARQAGIPDNDLLIDCLVLSAGAEQDAVMETVKAVSLVKKELGLNTLLGVSNISFGLPAREYVNAAFLAMGASAGLSASIVNPFNEMTMNLLAASRVILNQDLQARQYIAMHTEGSGEDTGGQSKDLPPDEALKNAVIEGQPEKAGNLAQVLLDQGSTPMEIGEGVLIPAMSVVGERFASNEYFLPQVIMSARAMKSAFEPVRAALKGEDLPSRGRILIATVEGDVHDIGKNIVITLLENHGFEVTDLGKNVPAEDIVKAAVDTGANAIGLSALMTTTMVKMEDAVGAIRDAGLTIPVVVGGAAVTPDFSDDIGADGYAEDATTAVTTFLELIGAGKGGS